MSEKKPKIEVIQIGLDNFDIEKEINRKVEGIIVDTGRFTNLRPVAKTERKMAQWDDKVQKTVALLIEAKTNDRVVPASEIMSMNEITQKQLGGFMTRIRTYLRRDDVWSLHKTKNSKGTNYHIMKFGD